MTIEELRKLAIGHHEVSILHKKGILTNEKHNPEKYKEHFFKFIRNGESLLLKITENNQINIQKLVCGIFLKEFVLEEDILLINN